MSVRRVSPSEASEMIEREGFIYLDVRSQKEFAAGHPLGAYNVPLLDLHPVSGRMMPNPRFLAVVQACFPRDSKIVVGCQAGGRSLHAATLMERAGYQHVVDQRAGYGGVRDQVGRLVEPGWEAEGLPTAEYPDLERDYAALAAKAGK